MIILEWKNRDPTGKKKTLEYRKLTQNEKIQYCRTLSKENPDEAITLGTEGMNDAVSAGDRQSELGFLEVIGKCWFDKNDFVRARECLEKTVVLADEAEDRKLEATAHNRLAILAGKQAEYPVARTHLERVIALSEASGDEDTRSAALINLGLVHYYTADFKTALENLMEGLIHAEKTSDYRRMASIYSNVAAIHSHYGDNQLAIEFNLKSLDLANKLDNLYLQTNCHLNLGILYNEIEQDELGETHLLKCLELNNRAQDPLIAIRVRGNLGSHYEKKGLYDKSEIFLKEAIEFGEKIPDPYSVSSNQNSLAALLISQGQLDRALEVAEKALQSAKNIDAGHLELMLTDKKRQIYYLMGEYKTACDLADEVSVLKDEIFQLDKQKYVAELQTKYETEKKEREAEIHRLKNVELVRVNQKLGTANTEIAHQQELIQSSIRYARKIQKAILPDQRLYRDLFSDAFILFKPKAIVSGDFHWLFRRGDHVLIAAVDCTGHGVPGAFMSLIGHNLLNSVAGSNSQLHTDEILDRLHKEVVATLDQESDTSTTPDGMDIALIQVSSDGEIEFSGAHRPLAVVIPREEESSELIWIRGDRQSIGGTTFRNFRGFTQNSLNVPDSAMVYLFSDGFLDQMNHKGRKLGIKTFKNLLKETAHLPCIQQKDRLLHCLKEYQQNCDQMDDITVIGLRLANS